MISQHSDGVIDYGQYGATTFVQTGWQCPVCQRVMAPFMPHCSFCAQPTKVTIMPSPISPTVSPPPNRPTTICGTSEPVKVVAHIN